ncbi:MAG: hypothetical protein IKJ81_00025 [Bacteroidales bacterium]|nr:hypothetical protein [Bacteroidales bacterium]
MKKTLILCAAFLVFTVTVMAQSDISFIAYDMTNEIEPWEFEIQCKVTEISNKYQVGDKQYYVITVEVVDTTYDWQLGILYGKDYRKRKVEMQIVSFASGRECDGTTIKKGRKYLFDLTFADGCCPIVGHGEHIPYWNVEGVNISTNIVERQPMKAEGLDGLCWFYRDTNRIDPKYIVQPQTQE